VNGYILRRATWATFLSIVILSSGCGGSNEGTTSTTGVGTTATALFSPSDVVAAFAASGIDLLVAEIPGTEMEAALSPAYQPDVTAEQFDIFVFRDVASARKRAGGATVEKPAHLAHGTVAAQRNVVLQFPKGSGPYSLKTVLDAMAHLE
jgi:hypothetical protein